MISSFNLSDFSSFIPTVKQLIQKNRFLNYTVHLVKYRIE